ncbi:M16 family metallopeptidase [Nibricoccus sp. IMCC34717]|uniref:M16 family metallopeptidase n=1 Tax=Nibricoccus sp. IMCC34717 TaxID=3034021 RepID=UPI00384DB680
MKFLHLTALVAALVLVCPFSHAQKLPDGPRFGHDSSDLKPDPEVRFGKLQNGLHYALRHNAEPRGRASLRLLILAGSLHEEENQRGLAHFLEHMAFNGSEHYAPDTLIEFFQRMGMSFGGDTNAHTSFDHTAYLLELPHTDDKTLDEGLRIFRDYAGGLLLLEKELEKERGIILAEKRDRDTAGLREWIAEASFVLAGTRLPERLPIGLEAVISGATRPQFADFYDTWYRPERMAIIAVGDFDVAALEKRLQDAFASLAPRGAARANPAMGSLRVATEPRAFWHREAESGATRVGIQVVRPFVDEPDTAAKRKNDLLRSLASAMVNRRLDTLARREGAPFSHGQLNIGDAFELVHSASIELTGKADQWKASLTVAEQELRRALQFGFTRAELAEAVANTSNAVVQAARTASTRRSDALADQLMQALAGGEVFTTPADDLARLQPVLAQVTPEACLEALREAFSGAAPVITVVGDATLADTQEAAQKAILEVMGKSAATSVNAPVEANATPFAYTDFGAAGTVAKVQVIDDLQVTAASFANGVRLNLKKTDFEAGKIRILVRAGGGLLTLPKDKPGLNLLADATLFTGALGKHSFDELRQVLAGKTLSVNFRTAGDAFTLTGETNADDLLLQLQLLAAYLTDPGLRAEALLPARKQFEQIYTQLEHVPEGPLQLEAVRLLASGDPRFGLPKKQELDARTLDEVRAWVAPQFAQGPLEITLVGDLDPEAAKAAVARTFGALPKRQPKPAFESERKAAFPAQPLSRTFEFTSEVPKALVYVAWPTTDNRDINVVRRLNILAEVFSDRLRTRVREQLGDAYSPFAMSSSSDSFRGYGTFAAIITAAPDKVDELLKVVDAIASDLVEKGVTDDDVERAKQPVLTSIRDAGRTNPYWIYNVLGASQEFPERLEWRRTIESGHAAITAAEIHALAKQYLPPAKAHRIVSRTPESAVALPKASPAPTKVTATPTPRVLVQKPKPSPTPRPTPTPVPDDF